MIKFDNNQDTYCLRITKKEKRKKRVILFTHNLSKKKKKKTIHTQTIFNEIDNIHLMARINFYKLNGSYIAKWYI